MYAAYIALFEPLLGASAPARPLQVENAVKVGGLGGGIEWVWGRVRLGGFGRMDGVYCSRRACLPGRLQAPRLAGASSCGACPHNSLAGSPPGPLLLPCYLPSSLLRQVGQKRGRSQLEELNAEVLDGTKRKKIRLVRGCRCLPVSAWRGGMLSMIVSAVGCLARGGFTRSWGNPAGIQAPAQPRRVPHRSFPCRASPLASG